MYVKWPYCGRKSFQSWEPELFAVTGMLMAGRWRRGKEGLHHSDYEIIRFDFTHNALRICVSAAIEGSTVCKIINSGHSRKAWIFPGAAEWLGKSPLALKESTVGQTAVLVEEVEKRVWTSCPVEILC